MFHTLQKTGQMSYVKCINLHAKLRGYVEDSHSTNNKLCSLRLAKSCAWSRSFTLGWSFWKSANYSSRLRGGTCGIPSLDGSIHIGWSRRIHVINGTKTSEIWFIVLSLKTPSYPSKGNTPPTCSEWHPAVFVPPKTWTRPGWVA